MARGLQFAKTKPGLLEQVQGLQLEGSVDSVPLPQSVSAVSDSHSDSGSESSVVSAGQQSDGEHSDSEQSEEMFFQAKIVDAAHAVKASATVCVGQAMGLHMIRGSHTAPWENLAIDH